jgi:hypothetical protein
MVLGALQQAALDFGGAVFAGEARDFGPGDDEAVVGDAFGGPALSVAKGIKPIGQVTGVFALGAEAGEELGGGEFALVEQGADQVLGGFPVGGAVVGFGLPVGGHFVALEQAHFAAFGDEDARFCHAFDAGVAGGGEGFGLAVGAVGVLVLLEPGDRPPGIAIKLAFLLGLEFVEDLVDQLQGGADAHGGAVGFEDGGVFGKNGHAGADAGLGQVYGGDVALLQGFEGFGEFAFEFGEELAAGGFGGVGGAGAADEDNRGSESVGFTCNHTIA